MSHLGFYHNLLIGLHIIAVIAWMAGLLYLPRLFAYHMRATPDGEMDLTFRTMEAKVMKIILDPAMIAVWILGLTLIWFDATQQKWGWSFLLTPWMLTKLAGVLFLTSWHHYLMRAQKRFARGELVGSERFWRATNELPFLAAIVMVLAITTKFAF
ncbi:MAG TPA: CopD family protein [Caulobacteraceae bacterium]|nr:CopD family protein [Caulobacteraceae bacterium]